MPNSMVGIKRHTHRFGSNEKGWITNALWANGQREATQMTEIDEQLMKVLLENRCKIFLSN
jgi:hypothetical protein